MSTQRSGMSSATADIDHLVDPVRAAQRATISVAQGRGWTVRGRLRVFVLVGVLLVMVVAATGLRSEHDVNDQANQTHVLVDARENVSALRRSIDALRGNVDRALLGAAGIGGTMQEDAAQNFLVGASDVGIDVTAAMGALVPASAHESIAQLPALLGPFMTQADRLSSLAFTDLAAATAAMPAFNEVADQIGVRLDKASAALDELIGDARERRNDVANQTALILAGMVALTAVLLGVCGFLLSRSLHHSLRRLGAVARSIATGNLEARVTITSDDELGVLARAINDMANDLQVLVGEMESSAERDGFGSQLAEALEMADTEPDALVMIERAMLSISSTTPMEILLADSSKAHFARAASNPVAGAPCCPVESPFSCIAVRRGNPVVFGNSDALNACPKLQGRASGAVSAVCVPVTFMGRALGVLHATSPVGSPPDVDEVGRLTALATQSGGRIGTVRSFERSQLQATTDGLTGLRNRRTIETELRGLLNEGVELTLVMADLDHFKLLNDTYGHGAGDRALRKFSQVVEASLRDSDIAGRFGGEEFVIALPGASMSKAVEVLDRLRERLAIAGEESDNPTFTASFGVVDSSMGKSLEELLRIADAALYRAKEEGRNRVTVADQRDVELAARSVEQITTTPATSARTPTLVSAFQRAASLDDPMPGAPHLR